MELIIFSRKYKKSGAESVPLRDSVISFADCANYVSILLDRKLNFQLDIMESSNPVNIGLSYPTEMYGCTVFQIIGVE